MSKLFAPALALTTLLAACGGSTFQSDTTTDEVRPGDPCDTDGARAASEDGCNTCTCDGGQWACTEIACAEGGTGAGGSGGEAGGSTGGGGGTAGFGAASTGGVAGSAGSWTAGTGSAGAPPTGGTGGSAGCVPGTSRVAPDACNMCDCTADGRWACTELACSACTDGETTSDGCNACSCSGGQWLCTARACAEPCPAPAPVDPDIGCAAVVVYAKSPTTSACCEYGSPCTAPAGWTQFYDLKSCNGQGGVDGGVTEKPCGGWLGDTCSASEYCAYEEGQLCGAADASAICKPIPMGCDLNYDPVCGCDGAPYSNACAAAVARTGVLHGGGCALP